MNNLPTWFNKYDGSPVASAAGWLKFKVAGADRQVLLETQKEHDAFLRQMPGGNPHDLAKAQWCRLREKHRQTGDPKILDQLAELGDRGVTRAGELYARKRVIRSAARCVADSHNCSPVYARVFQSAAETVLERIRDTEQAERAAHEMIDFKYTPSPLLKALAHLANRYLTDAAVYRERSEDLKELPVPAHALGPELWAVIVNSERKVK